MQFKKIAALTGTALMTTMSVAAPVLGATVSNVSKISDIVSVSSDGTSVSFPLFVVGSNAKMEDVAGGINVATYLAGKATVTKSVTSSSGTETAKDGVKIRTPGNELNLFETAPSVKNILTATDISILKDGTYAPSSGSSSAYKQYLYIGGESASTTLANTLHLEYSRPTNENTPRASLKLPNSQIVYTYKLSFNTPVSLSSVTNTATLQSAIQGTVINLMGNDFVISDATWGSATRAISDITLLGGKNVVTLDTTEDKTVTSGGKDFKIHLDGVAQETVSGTTYLTALGSVNGEAFSLRAGQTKTLTDGTVVGAVKVLQGKTGAADFAQLAIGAEKIKISAGGSNTETNPTGSVTKGSSTVSGLTTNLNSAGTTWSSMRIGYAPTEDKFLNVGDKWSDSFAGLFDLKFNSMSPASDSTSERQKIEFNPSGFNMLMKFKNAAGNNENDYTLYYDSTNTNWRWASAALSGTTENSWRDVLFDENSNVSAVDGDYFVVNSGGFSRMLKFTSWDASNSLLTFTDEAGNSIQIYNTTEFYAPLIVDGNTFSMALIDSSASKKVIQIDMNRDNDIAGVSFLASAAAILAQASLVEGKDYAFMYPKMIDNGKGGLYFYGRTTGRLATGAGAAIATGNRTVRSLQVGSSSFATVGLIPLNLTITASGANSVLTVYNSAGTSLGTLTNVTGVQSQLNISGNSDTNFLDFVVRMSNETSGSVAATAGTLAVDAALGTATTGALTAPGMVLVEEAQEGGSTHSWIYVPVSWSSTYNHAGTYAALQSDDSNFYPGSASNPATVIGTTGKSKGMTLYGTEVEYDTTAGTSSLSYPDSFVFGNLFILSPSGVISGGGAGGTTTYKEAVAITGDVVKLDSEVTDADKSGKDLVLIGGPCINTLVAALNADSKKVPYGCSDWPGENFGWIGAVADAFASGKTALVIAGTRAADTDLAARVVQDGTKLASSTGTSAKITGTSLTDVVVS